MIFRIYGFKNRLLGSFESPVSDVLDGKDYIERLSMTLMSADLGVVARYKEFDVYCLGEFDSKSGEYISKNNEFVGSLESMCLQIIEHRQKSVGDNNGREETASV